MKKSIHFFSSRFSKKEWNLKKRCLLWLMYPWQENKLATIIYAPTIYWSTLLDKIRCNLHLYVGKLTKLLGLGKTVKVASTITYYENRSVILGHFLGHLNNLLSISFIPSKNTNAQQDSIILQAQKAFKLEGPLSDTPSMGPTKMIKKNKMHMG